MYFIVSERSVDEHIEIRTDTWGKRKHKWLISIFHVHTFQLLKKFKLNHRSPLQKEKINKKDNNDNSKHIHYFLYTSFCTELSYIIY